MSRLASLGIEILRTRSFFLRDMVSPGPSLAESEGRPLGVTRVLFEIPTELYREYGFIPFSQSRVCVSPGKR